MSDVLGEDEVPESLFTLPEPVMCAIACCWVAKPFDNFSTLQVNGPQGPWEAGLSKAH